LRRPPLAAISLRSLQVLLNRASSHDPILKEAQRFGIGQVGSVAAGVLDSHATAANGSS